MTALRVLPHRTVAEERVAWGAWWRITEEGTRTPVGPRLDSWDYAQSIELASDVEVDVAAAAADAGLCASSTLAIVATWDCPASMDRGVAVECVTARPPDGRWTGTLYLTVPPGDAARELILERHVVLLSPGPNGQPLSAKMRGARLGPSSRDRLLLEGDGGRFPIEPLDFAAAGRERAAWALEITYGDPTDSFLGSLRLLVNSGHPAGRALLSSAEDRPDLLSVLYYDVVRRLLTVLSTDLDSFTDVTARDDDSLSAVAESICQTYLRMDLVTALRRVRDDPGGFEAALQARTGFLEDLGSQT